MMKIALAVAAAAAVLTTARLVTPAKAQGVKMAQVDVRTGRHLDDRDDRYYRDRRGYDSDATVGVGPGGVTIGSGQRCRRVTTTVEGDNGRMIRRKERRCD
ncbi:MAG: hypothetical protein ACJ8FZ_00480 [Bradyrhizobium sp.]